MEQRPEPEVFYGAAIAALTGLLFGLMFHSAWEKKPGGPQILFSSAAAATPADPSADDRPTTPAQQVDLAQLDTGHVNPNPLPVVRLHPEMFDVQPAAAGEVEREEVETLLAPARPAPPRDVD